jgi:hypothetical protein
MAIFIILVLFSVLVEMLCGSGIWDFGFWLDCGDGPVPPRGKKKYDLEYLLALTSHTKPSNHNLPLCVMKALCKAAMINQVVVVDPPLEQLLLHFVSLD